MAMMLRQSTASQEILLGPFVDSTDGNTAETALTIANTDIKIYKDGATTLADKNSGGATHISNGYYYTVLDATDTDTVGKLEVNVKVSGALAVRREFQVLEEAVYDALFAASAAGYQVPIWASASSTVSLTNTTVATVTTTTTATNVTTVNGLAANVITAASIAASALNGKGDWFLASSAPSNFSSLAITAGGIVQADLQTIKTQTVTCSGGVTIPSATLASTTNITAGTITTATNVTTVNGIAAGAITAAAIATDAIDADALAADAIAEINATVDTALADVRLDELLAADSDIDGAAPPTVGSVFHELMTKTAGSFTYDQTTDSLEALRDRGDTAWITATGFSTHTAADVWAVATRQLTGTQTFNLTGNITGNLSGSVGSVTGAVGSVTGNVGGNVTGSVGSIATGGIAAASFAAGAINAAAIATDAGDEIADRVWEDVTSDHSTIGTFGYAVRDLIQYTGTDIPALITTVDTVVDAIKVKTDYLPSATAGASGGLFIAGSNAATTVNITGNITGNLSGSVGSVTGTIGGLSAAALKDFFDTDSTTTYASAVAGSVVKEIVDNAGGGGLTVGAIADAVWDEASSGHLTAGTTGAKLNTAGGAADPLENAVPGSYLGGTAGHALGLLGSGSVTFAGSAVNDNDGFEITQGDAYLNSDGLAFSWTFGASPSLSGATVVLRIQGPGTSITSITCTVTGAGTATQVVKADITAAQSLSFDPGNYSFDIQATLSSGSPVTLVREAGMNVKPQVI